jgi:hypothetical protein
MMQQWRDCFHCGKPAEPPLVVASLRLLPPELISEAESLGISIDTDRVYCCDCLDQLRKDRQAEKKLGHGVSCSRAHRHSSPGITACQSTYPSVVNGMSRGSGPRGSLCCVRYPPGQRRRGREYTACLTTTPATGATWNGVIEHGLPQLSHLGVRNV